MLQMTTSAIGA